MKRYCIYSGFIDYYRSSWLELYGIYYEIEKLLSTDWWVIEIEYDLFWKRMSKYVVATTSLRVTNKLLINKLKSIVSYGNYKRTWQGVPNTLLPYFYNRYMVCANNKYAYSNVHVLSWVYHTVFTRQTCFLT